MTDARAFRGLRFQAEVILWAVRWYVQFPISYRDLKRMLADRDTAVDDTTMYRWSSASPRSSRSACAGTCGRAVGRGPSTNLFRPLRMTLPKEFSRLYCQAKKEDCLSTTSGWKDREY